MLFNKKQLDEMRREYDLIRAEYLGWLNWLEPAQDWFNASADVDFRNSDKKGRPNRLARTPATQLHVPVKYYGAEALYGVQIVPYPDYIDVCLRVWSRYHEGPSDPVCFVPDVASSGKVMYIENTITEYNIAEPVTPSSEDISGRVVVGMMPVISSTWDDNARPLCALWEASMEWDQLHSRIADSLQSVVRPLLFVGLFPLPPGATEKRVPDCDDLMRWWQSCGLISATDWDSDRQNLRGYRPTFINSALDSRDAVGVTGVNGPPSPAGILLPHNWDHGIEALRDASNPGVNLAAQLDAALEHQRQLNRMPTEHSTRISINGHPVIAGALAPTEYISTHTDNPGYPGPVGPAGIGEIHTTGVLFSREGRTSYDDWLRLVQQHQIVPFRDTPQEE